MGVSVSAPARMRVLGPDDPAPAVVLNPGGRSPFLLIGDHAGSAIPASLGGLGLRATDRQRHIAIDIGVRELGDRLSSELDATFIRQPYSRLVVDCNRDPFSSEAIPEVSDGTPIPGNERLAEEARHARIEDILLPYHARIAEAIAARGTDRRATILVSLHSFTPVLGTIPRPWHVGLLYMAGRSDFATALLEQLTQRPGLVVGDNQPYRMDATDYSVPRHAFLSGLRYAELEVRQDLIADDGGQRRWAEWLAEDMTAALGTLPPL